MEETRRCSDPHRWPRTIGSPLRTGRDHRRAQQHAERRRPRFEQPMLTIGQLSVRRGRARVTWDAPPVLWCRVAWGARSACRCCAG